MVNKIKAVLFFCLTESITLKKKRLHSLIEQDNFCSVFVPWSVVNFTATAEIWSSFSGTLSENGYSEGNFRPHQYLDQVQPITLIIARLSINRILRYQAIRKISGQESFSRSNRDRHYSLQVIRKRSCSSACCPNCAAQLSEMRL